MQYNPQMQMQPQQGFQQGAPMMGYNNFYNPYFQAYNPQPQHMQQQNIQPQTQQPQPEPQPQQDSGYIAWVEGLDEVEAKVLTPGSAFVYFDKNVEGQYYIRTRTQTGQYQTRVFTSTEVTNGAQPNVDMSAYVTKQELSEMLEQFKAQNNKPATVINAPSKV